MYSLKTLKALRWIFGILFLFRCVDLFRELVVEHSFSGIHSIFAFIFLISFITVTHNIKNKQYKTA